MRESRNDWITDAMLWVLAAVLAGAIVMGPGCGAEPVASPVEPEVGQKNSGDTGTSSAPTTTDEPTAGTSPTHISTTGTVKINDANHYTVCLYKGAFGAGKLVGSYTAKPGRTPLQYECPEKDRCGSVELQLDIAAGAKYQCPPTPFGGQWVDSRIINTKCGGEWVEVTTKTTLYRYKVKNREGQETTYNLPDGSQWVIPKNEFRVKTSQSPPPWGPITWIDRSKKLRSYTFKTCGEDGVVKRCHSEFSCSTYTEKTTERVCR